MATIARQLTDLVRAAADAAGHADSPVPLEPCVPCNDPAHGDYQSNFAFRLGKSLRTNPRAVAEAVRAAMPDSPLVATVEVAGPGFLNIRLADDALGADLVTRAADPRLGAERAGEGRKVVIDYSSPNIAKRMHIGHIRSTVIGSALDRMHRFLGFEVVADNHIGDWGTPFGKLMVAWHGWRDDDAFAADPVGELQRLYASFGDRAKEDPSLDDAAREHTAELQAGDPETTALWKRFCEVSLAEFDQVYARLDVAFDVIHGESFYEPMLDDAVQRLLDAGIAEVDEGATIVRFAAEDGKGLKDKVLVLRKSDGAATYGLTDVATILHRVDALEADAAKYVVDVRQGLHFRMLFAIARRLGLSIDLEHVGFGMLRFPDGMVASSRAGGQSVNLVDVLDEAARRARAVVDAHAGDIPDEAERAAVAEAVGLGAVKYADLSQNPSSDVTFDWEEVLSLQGNTAPYLLYPHARCRSILRRAATEGHGPGPVAFSHAFERDLALSIVRLPEVVEVAVASSRPNLLATQLYEIASTFNRFYVECPVLKAGVAPDVRASRLALVQATASALKTGLGLLGLRTPDRM